MFWSNKIFLPTMYGRAAATAMTPTKTTTDYDPDSTCAARECHLGWEFLIAHWTDTYDNYYHIV